MRIGARSLWIACAALAACGSGVSSGLSVAVSPASVTLDEGASQSFSAIVDGSTNQAVVWSVTQGGGTISSAGIYVAPGQPGTITVRATALADSKAFGLASVTVLAIDAGNDGGAPDGGDGGDAGPGTPDAGPSDGGLSLTSFTASPVSIAQGQSTTLSWTALGAAQLTLQQVGQSAMAVSGSSAQVRPSTSATYLLTASSGASSITLPLSVTVHAASPAPLIEQLVTDSSSILSGNATTLRWTVVNATQVTLTPFGTVPAAGTKTVSPTQDTTYTLSATSAAGRDSASVALAVSSSPLLTPVPPGGGDVQLAIDSSLGVHPISPDIYGMNASISANAPVGTGLLRRGGGEFTAYNWETNASNEGSAGNFANDAALDGGAQPAGAILPTLASARSASFGAIVTVPIQGYVAADESGPVDPSGPAIARFLPSAPRKITPFSQGPDLADRRVFDDELAHALAQAWSGQADAGPLRFALDDAPDRWFASHPEIEKAAVTYAELINKTLSVAPALKDAAPAALIHGPVLSGWSGFTTLQSASDAAGRDFIDAYLQALQAESQAEGRRVLDVLDLQFLSQATAGSIAVTAGNNTAAVQAARMQAPRSLWDPIYVEASPITGSGAGNTAGAAIQLLPRMLAKIAAAFPGTRLAISAYSHGGGDDISGAIAQADALGIFGQQGIDAAAAQPILSSEPYLAGAFRAFRDYDNAGAAFGNTSLAATSSDVAKVSIYASQNLGQPGKLIAVIINRDTLAHTAQLTLRHSQALTTATVWTISKANQSGSSIIPKQASAQTALSGFNATTISLPALSVNTVVLQ